jgi:ABC-type phosphate/phosphonate transport system ATPase subunit
MLVLDRVSKTYPNGVRALEDVSLQVAAGELLIIIGGSGCGKSTFCAPRAASIRRRRVGFTSMV